MNVMRRLKSIASGRSSVSDPGGDSSIKRVKVEQEVESDVSAEREPEPQSVEKTATAVEQPMDATSTDMAASTSNTTCTDKPEKSDFDELPKEMHEMKIKEDKSEDKEVEATVVNGNGTEKGQIIVTSVGGRNGQPKQTLSYMAERVVSTGSFGVVFEAKCLETGESVAIKKVLQSTG